MQKSNAETQRKTERTQRKFRNWVTTRPTRYGHGFLCAPLRFLSVGCYAFAHQISNPTNVGQCLLQLFLGRLGTGRSARTQHPALPELGTRAGY